MYFFARIDPLRRISELELFICFETAYLFQYRQAVFFRTSWIHCGLIYDIVSRFKGLSYRPGSSKQGGKVGLVVLIDRRRHRYNEERGLTQFVDGGCEFYINILKC